MYIFIGLLSALVCGVLGTLVYGWQHQRWLRHREKRDALRLLKAEEQGLHLPLSLHPQIDPDLCSGCLACQKACPEGELFGIRNGKAILIEAAKCIGHGVCAKTCPTGAIRLVFGNQERGVDLPQLNPDFETQRHGIYIVGELGGMGLIRNAIKQGLDVAQTIHHTLQTEHRQSATKHKAPFSTDKDVAIIGAGSAGIAAALGCHALQLDYRIVDQSTVGGTIQHYPRQKLAMVEGVDLPLYGKLEGTLTKDALIEAFQTVLDKAHIHVHEQTKVLDIRGMSGRFSIVTTEGTFTARKVILAIGRRGTPRQLNIRGEHQNHVMYTLSDPEQYRQQTVVVVGGGDSAVESACMLADAGAKVALCHRRNHFNRCHQDNRERLLRYQQEGRVQIFIHSEVKEIGQKQVLIRRQRKTNEVQNLQLPADYVLIQIGGELPTQFLKQIDIPIQQHYGHQSAHGGSESEAQHRSRKRLARILYFSGTLFFLLWTVLAWDYLRLSIAARALSDWHHWLAPHTSVGKTLGIVATLFMMSNFLYSARKRKGWFRSISMQTWMMLHTFTGLFGTGVALYHACFEFQDPIASATMYSAAVLALTGLAGRYLQSWVPRAKPQPSTPATKPNRLDTEPTEYRRLQQKQTQIGMSLQNLAQYSEEPTQARGMVSRFTQIQSIKAPSGLWASLFRLPRLYLQQRRALKDLRTGFARVEDYRKFQLQYQEGIKVALQLAFYDPLQRAMQTWRILHVMLAFVFTLLLFTHIAWAMALGMVW